MKLKGGDAGKSKLQVKGMNIPMPVPASMTQLFTNATGVTAQLFEANGDCYETAFAIGDALENDATQFKAKK